jgi:hypothetical protein
MTWLTDLDPTLAAAVVSAVVSLVVVVFTTLLAPSVKYGFDRRLELRKLEFTYEAQQRKALRDHIGYHKGTILASADELASRIHRYQTARDAPNWLRGAPGDYFPRSFAFRIVNYWFALNGFAQDAIYIDAAAATRTDWAFAKAVKLNLGHRRRPRRGPSRCRNRPAAVRVPVRPVARHRRPRFPARLPLPRWSPPVPLGVEVRATPRVLSGDRGNAERLRIRTPESADRTVA